MFRSVAVAVLFNSLFLVVLFTPPCSEDNSLFSGVISCVSSYAVASFSAAFSSFLALAVSIARPIAPEEGKYYDDLTEVFYKE